jgi:acyl-coenzyme A synthetase/AMP-(fatty) acid ligase
MLKTASPTVLSQAQRYLVANDPSIGGGNLLQSALAYNPRPDVPFIRPVRPIAGTDGVDRHELSLLDLDHLAQSWSVWYRARQVKPRDRVAIFLRDSFAYSIHYHALAQIGAIPVMINSNAPSASAISLLRQTTPVGLYTDEARLQRVWLKDAGAIENLRWHAVVEELPAPPPAELPASARYAHVPTDPVSILHSSGTTGFPKPVVQTHHSSVAGPRFRMLSHVELPGALMMTALPQSHLGCIAYSSYAVLCGTPLVALYDANGEVLADAVAEHRPTSVMAFSHAYGELATLDVREGSLDSVGTWVSMGDAIHEAHIQAIVGRRSADLAPAQFFDRLGTSELGWGVLLHVTTGASTGKGRCVGTPTGVAEVAVLRADGTEAAPGEYGLLGAKGPAITAGYWNDSDTTYRSRLAGFWLTGDVAYRDEAGAFYMVDRAVDAIETAEGAGYSVYMEEVVLSEVAEVADCAVVAGALHGESVAVGLVRPTLEGADPQSLLEAASAALRAAGLPGLTMLEVARTDADYPVGVTGKVLKRQLRERYADLAAYAARDAERILSFESPARGVAAAA